MECWSDGVLGRPDAPILHYLIPSFRLLDLFRTFRGTDWPRRGIWWSVGFFGLEGVAEEPEPFESLDELVSMIHGS
jgi:hypothetical protein